MRYVGHSHHAPPTLLDVIFSVCVLVEVGVAVKTGGKLNLEESNKKEKENVMRMRYVEVKGPMEMQ